MLTHDSSSDMDIHALCRRNILQLYSIGDMQSAVGDILTTFTEPRSMHEDVANVGEKSIAQIAWSH